MTKNNIVKVSKDRVFKTLFGTIEGKYLLESLLSDILEEKIEIVEYKDKELPIINITEKNKIIDLLVKARDELIHVEINSRSSSVIKFRNFIYFAKIIAANHKVGEEYDNNQKYVSINLSARLSKKHELIEKYKIQNDKKVSYIDNITIYEVNMDLAREFCYNGDIRPLVRHIASLTMTRSEIEKYKEGDKFMETLAKRLDELHADDIWFVTPEEDDMMIFNSEKRMAREEGRAEGLAEGHAEGHAEGLAEGLAEGHAEGHAEGLAEGRVKGLAEGRAEGLAEAKREIAIKFLQEGISLDTIAKGTGLTKKEIEELKSISSSEE